jgi:hypothetical protein
MNDSEADAWRDQVRALAERLNANGCIVNMDLFDRGDDTDWSRYGPRMIDEADFTLIVASKAYRERWDGDNPPREGAGATREINTMKGIFNKDRSAFQNKFRVIELPGITGDDIPDEIFAVLLRYRVDPFNDAGLEILLRDLTSQPEFSLPPAGTIPLLPPRSAVT